MDESIVAKQEMVKDLHCDLSQLPEAKGWTKPGFRQFQGCWINSGFLSDVIAFQQQFRARDKDIVFASHPKCGTTWLKALLFSVANRHVYTSADSPLLTTNPHMLVPTLELLRLTFGPDSDLNIQSPATQRLYATHVPYALLPEGIVGQSSSDCRIVYICRNPLDTITSFWKFMPTGSPNFWPEWTLEECVETFCKGESSFGPFWDHLLGFWKASLEKPEKVLFLKYEDMLENTRSEVKKIARFLGFPFSEEEEASGVVDQIIELCSLKKMKELEVNKHGKMSHKPIEFKYFFRKGENGDWVNHLSPAMVEKVKNIIEEKFHGSGLTFTYPSTL